jgi:hypothetical protein
LNFSTPSRSGTATGVVAFECSDHHIFFVRVSDLEHREQERFFGRGAGQT